MLPAVEASQSAQWVMFAAEDQSPVAAANVIAVPFDFVVGEVPVAFGQFVVLFVIDLRA
jgi:hypothetical protein